MIFFQSEGTAARRRFPVYLVDVTDGLTPETGEAAGQPQISKAGGAFANTTATLTAIGNGNYYVELTATELNTLGAIIVRYKSANTAEFSLSAPVVAVNVHDSVRAGLTALPNAAAEAAGGLYTRGSGAGQINQPANGMVDVNGVRHLGTAYAAPTVAGVPKVEVSAFVAGAITAAAFAVDAIAAAAVKADAVTKIAAGTWATVLEGSHTAGDLMRGAIAAFVGKATNFLTGTIVIKSLNGAKTRWTITTDATGRLTVTAGDLT